MYLLQIGDVKELLSTESITVIGLLLAVCGLLLWDKIREEGRYKELYIRYEHEQEENKKLLIDLVTKSILATEKNTQAIDAIRDAIHRK